MCRVDNIREKYNGQTKLYDFYRECYPTDTEMIEKINRNATFQDAFECLQVGFNFYAFLGVDDSLVRERMFDALATLMGCSYEHIYYQWLDHSKEPFGLQMVTDMTGLRFKNENLGILFPASAVPFHQPGVCIRKELPRWLRLQNF